MCSSDLGSRGACRRGAGPVCARPRGRVRRGRPGVVLAPDGSLLIRPQSAITHRNLGDAHSHLGRKDDARRAYLKAVEQAQEEVSLGPSNARVIARLAVYQAKAGDDAAALRSLKRAQDLAADDQQVLQRAAVVHALAGRTGPALDAIEKAIANGCSRRLIAEEEDFTLLQIGRAHV